MTTTKWDTADYLDSDEMARAYIEVAFDEGDPEAAIRNVARARQIELPPGDLTLPSVIEVMGRIGLKLAVHSTSG